MTYREREHEERESAHSLKIKQITELLFINQYLPNRESSV